ncbi:hypothetical protein TGAM01_v206511 [Trichoderma gamsii]|uniref:Uncharacterized protein n=1 Tax=Trichoderma gamsii TaxID=398673 RepID=A0A2P4ZJV2_9HYPO|nr:hypothetical protein TGAM01_v206511 [Trichoderma gamsii]PON24581.1 hypothetical protein TGAM01_v206511 [Trichoderma gamsii]
MPSSEDTPLQQTEDVATVKKHKKGNSTKAYISIVLLAALPSIILSAATALLIVFTFRNRVILSDGSSELQTPHTTGNSSLASKTVREFIKTGGSDAYYIQFNPSTLTTIASITGKFVPYLSSAIMALAALFAADFVQKTSQKEQNDKLLTPNQLSLLVGLFSGRLEELWKAGRARKSIGGKFVAPISSTLTILIIVSALGVLIPAVDTWFGIVVKPSEQTQLNFTTPSNHSFSRGFLQGNDCSYSDYHYPCEALEGYGADGNFTPYLPTDKEPFKILNNISTENIVSNLPSNSSQSLFYLLDAAASSNLDFKANAFAISTQCAIISVRCQQDGRNVFDCTKKLSNQVTSVTKVNFKFYDDSSLQQNISYPNYSFLNPLYFTVYLTVGTQFGPAGPGLLTGTLGFGCSSTIFDATYAWVDGSIAQFNVTPTNGSIGGVMSAPFINDNANISQQAIMSSMARLSTNYSDVVPLTAAAFSHSALALSHIGMEKRANIVEQSRSMLSLTRVPIVPFYILIVLNALYVLCTVSLATAAMIWAHPKESTAVKAQLTMEGFMTAVFNGEGIRAQTQDSESSDGSSSRTVVVKEVPKIAILKTDQGGWSYATVMTNGEGAVVKLIQSSRNIRYTELE